MSTTLLQTDKNKATKIIIAFAAIYIIWGTTYLAIRIAVETIPPFLMAGTRFLIAGIITFAFLWARGVSMPTITQWYSAAIVGALLLVGGNGLVTWSEQQIPSGIAALVVATMPLWMTLFDWLIYGGAIPSTRSIVGFMLGFLGIGLLLGPGLFQETATFDLPSLLILLMAPILWSLGSLQSRQAELPQNLFMATAAEMLVGGALLVMAGLLTGEAESLHIAAISTHSWLAMLYLTIFGSIVALPAYVWLLKSTYSARVSTYTYVNPVIAVFLGWLILNEPLSRQTLAAVVVIILAVILITTQRQKVRPPKRLTSQAELVTLPAAVSHAPAADSRQTFP